MSGFSETDLEFCWDHVLEQDSWFRLHFLFAPRKEANAILALHALMAKLEGVLNSSEESIALSQLAWWRSELEPENAMASAHPIIRALREGRNMQALPAALSDPLIAQVLLRLQAEPLGDKAALKDLCNRIGRAKLVAESELFAEEVRPAGTHWRCAGSGLASLMDSAIKTRQKAWWFVPLELQAKHQFARQDMRLREAGTRKVIRTLCEWNESWFEEQVRDVGKSDSEHKSIQRHLVAMSSVQRLRLRRSAMDLMEGGSGEPGQWGIKDLLAVWSSSRRALKIGE